jgi:hypothetical protein
MMLFAGIIQCDRGLTGMSSFLTFMARPVVRRVTKRSILGRRYTTVGSLFIVIGRWAYEQGGLLGYCLRDVPSLLAKLAAPPGIKVNEEQFIEEIKELSRGLEPRLNECKVGEKTLWHLYTVRKLRAVGVHLPQPLDKDMMQALGQKATVDCADDVMREAFMEGVAFGFCFPRLFIFFRGNTHTVMQDSGWLDGAIVETTEGAITWNKNQSPKILDSDDIRVLQGIIEAHKKRIGSLRQFIGRQVTR